MIMALSLPAPVHPLHQAVVACALFYCYGDHRALRSFPTRRSSDLASAFGSSGATSQASVGETTSGTPPTAVATIGTRLAMASNSTIGVPSVRELKTNTSNAL